MTLLVLSANHTFGYRLLRVEFKGGFSLKNLDDLGFHLPIDLDMIRFHADDSTNRRNPSKLAVGVTC